MSKVYGQVRDLTYLTVPTILLAVACYVLSFFSKPVETLTFSKDMVLNVLFNQPVFAHPGVVSAIVAGAFTFLICFSIYYVGEKLMPDKNGIIFIPMMYLLISTAVPEARFFTPYHIVTLLMVWAIYCVVNFRMQERNIEGLFLSIFLVGVASLFYLPMIWFTILLILVNLSAEINKLKYLLVTLTAIITPFLIYFALIYLFWDFGNVQAKFALCLDYLKGARLAKFDFSMPDLIFAATLSLTSIIAAVGAMAHLDDDKVITARTYVRMIIAMIGMAGISLFYDGTMPSVADMMIFFPIPFLFFDFFSERTKKAPAAIFYVIIAGAVVYLKIAQLA
jgi:hypothetical protein